MLESLIDFLNLNPHYIYLFIFCIAIMESLAVVGIILPGVALLSAVSILAGELHLPIAFILLSAILGAILGDALSFMLGQFFEKKLQGFWPFKTHPNWIESGHEFFLKHGGKSIFIGRFIGPLRPFVPLAAGMLQMPAKKFYALNILSAVCWAPIYTLPAYYFSQMISLKQLFSWQGILVLVLVSAVAIVASVILKKTKKRK